jgi:RNA polymerase sigma-70 factor (ECF subfamily)
MMTLQDPPPRRAADAIEALLDAHGAEVYRHLRRLSPTADDAADLHQETFLRAFRALPALPADANHRAWLHRIAANAAADAHRRRAVRAAHVVPTAPGPRSMGDAAGPDGSMVADGAAVAGTDEAGATGSRRPSGSDLPADALAVHDPAADPAARAEAAELRSAVRAALADLPWRERTAVVARVLEDRDYPDVADLLDCSETNARQLVSRGLRRVRTSLGPYLEIDR